MRWICAAALLVGCGGEPAGTREVTGPVVSQVVPATGSARGGEEVAVRGLRLGGATAVRFGETDVEFEAGDGELRVVTPRALAGAVDVEVETPDGSDVLPDGFAYQPLDVRYQDHTVRLGIAGPRGRDLFTADFDGDGDPDIAFAVRQGPNRMLVNDGGNLRDESGARLPGEYDFRESVADTIGLAAADFDFDGDVDLYFANYAGQQDRLYLNDGAGFFSDETDRLPEDAAYDHAAAAADLDGDGDLDLVIAVYGAAKGATRQNRVLLNQAGPDGGARFEAAPDALPPDDDATAHVAAGDLDGDGDTDLVVANDQAASPLRLYLNDGAAAFAEAPPGRLPAQTESARRVLLGDVDGDGDTDLVVLNRGQDRLYLNDGAGRFSDATWSRMPVDVSVSMGGRLADLDLDGDLDLIVANYEWQNRLYLNDGTGGFDDWTALALPADVGPGIDVAAADLEGDGDYDLVITQENGQPVLLYVME